MPESTSKPRRRFFQFGLGGIFLFLTLATVILFCWWQGHHYASDRAGLQSRISQLEAEALKADIQEHLLKDRIEVLETQLKRARAGQSKRQPLKENPE